MKCLLDTHVLLWYMSQPDQLSDRVKQTIQNPRNLVYVSMVSFWEISIKRSLGKLKLSVPTEAIFQECKHQNISILNIHLKYILQLEDIPFHHRDPFDRLLIAQASVENLVLITKDPKISDYEVSCLW